MSELWLAGGVKTNLHAVVLPWRGGARWPPATFFVRKAKAFQQMANGGVLDLQASGISQGIAQFKQGDVGVLSDQFPEEGFMRRELACATRATLRGRVDPTCLMNLPCSSRPRR